MATPSKKHPLASLLLDTVTNRTEAITNDCCVNPPIGCGGPATEFRTPLDAREFTISGLCQSCQDKIFGDHTNR